MRAQNQMHATFLSTVCRITPGRQIVVIEPAKKITDGRVTDEQMLRVILRGVDTLLDEICLFQACRSGSMPQPRSAKKAASPRAIERRLTGLCLRSNPAMPRN